MPCRRLAQGEFVTQGERVAADRVHDHLVQRPESWTLLLNVQAHLGRTIREIDQIVVGPNGVFVIDVKSFGGRVECGGGSWTLSSGATRTDPLASIHHLAGSVRGELKRVSALLNTLWVEGVLLFTEPIELRGLGPTQMGQCFQLDELDRLFGQAPPRGSLSSQQLDQILKAFSRAGYLRKRQAFTRIGDFTLERRLEGPETPHRVSYQARDRHRNACVVRVYDLSSVPSTQRDRALAQAQAEYEALDAAHKARVPGLVRVLAPFQEVADFGDGLYSFAVESPGGATLADRLADPGWPRHERLLFARDLCRTVARIHQTRIPNRPDACLVHRRLHPRALHLLSETGPDRFLISGFDVARATPTTAYPGQAPFQLTEYDAPELQGGLIRASHRSDIYSLGVITYQLFTGRLPSRDADGDLIPLGPDEAPPTGTPEDWTALLDLMLAERPEARVDRLEDLLELWGGLDAQPRPAQEARPRVTHPVTVRAQLAEGLVVERLLGRGGSAWTYLVRSQADGRPYVAKVLQRPDPARLDSVRREFGLLQLCTHEAIVRALSFSGLPDSPCHLTLEYCDGEPMGEVSERLLGLAEERGISPVELVEDWLTTLLSALSEVHARGIFHGDVSPSNILWTGRGLKLIDFGLGGLTTERLAEGRGGTFPYCPPEGVAGAGPEAGPRGDLYGLAATMAHVLLGRLPFDDEEGIRQDRLRPELLEEGSRLHRVLARALDPDPGARYVSASAMRADLRPPAPEAAADLGEAAPVSAPVAVLEPAPQGWHTVPYLEELLKLYPASALGASETRGLETSLAQQTYVETLLDRNLRGAITSGELGLVLLSGNPGDGKTAFLQRLAQELGLSPEALRGRREWEAVLPDGRRVCANLDASASIGERDSDEVLDAFLAPFVDGLPEGRTALVAINDGRLLEWIEERHSDDGRWLFTTLRRLVEDRELSVPGVLLIDLNDRSLVGQLDGEVEGSVFRRLLGRLVGGVRQGEDPWAPCATCLARSRCPVRYNVETLRDPSAPLVLERAELLLQAVHFRNQVHVTMRQLRGALSYWFFGTRPCAEIHALVAEAAGPAGGEAGPDALGPLEAQLYHHALFEGPASGVPLLRQLRELDPARADHPLLDRRLHLLETEAVLACAEPFQARAELPTLEGAGGPPSAAGEARRLGGLRRRLFFEAGARALERLGVEGAAELTPFPAVSGFKARLTGEVAPGETARWLCRALTRAAGLGGSWGDGETLLVRLYDQAVTVTRFFRQFPAGRFEVWVDARGQASPYLEWLPTRFRFSAGRGGGVELEVDLDLYEVLDRLARGYRLGNPETEAFLGNLELFRQRLLHLPGPEDPVLIEHPNHGRLQARAYLEAGRGVRVLALEEVSGGE